MGCGRRRQSRRCSPPAPRASSSGRPRCETRRSPRDSSPPTGRTGSPSRSTSATAWRSGEGWRDGAPGIGAEEAIGALADAGVDDVRGDRHRARRPPRRARPRSLTRLVGLGRGAIIASGGIASLDDLRAVRQLGCAGAIVGRALYEGRFDIGSALAASCVGHGTGRCEHQGPDQASRQRPEPIERFRVGRRRDDDRDRLGRGMMQRRPRRPRVRARRASTNGNAKRADDPSSTARRRRDSNLRPRLP